LDENDVVAIYGGGEHTERLMGILKGECTVQYIFDKNSDEKRQCAIPVLKSCEIKNYHDITAVLISSFHYRTEMKQELADFSSKVKIIDIYDCLEKEYDKFEEAFYQVVPEISFAE
jgi:hypothetical protein